MNHAQNSSLTQYMRDLRILSVCLTWNLRSCPPMFAGSALYAIPGFEQLKTSRKSLRSIALFYVILRNFCVVCVVLTRTMREIYVEYQ